jgi:uncharacterized protein YdeI (YjbR/CyaY-like superfamily)
MIEKVDDFFAKGCGRCGRFDTPDCASQIWAEGLRELRAVCRESGLAETVKWGHPCYMLGERNIALIGALRGDFRLIFMNAALMTDPEGVLERQGANTRHPDMIRLSGAARVDALRPTILAYLQEARGYAAAGLKPPHAPAEFALPDELVEALDADPELAEAFLALTPGRQRSYVLNLNAAKAAVTRMSRIAKFRDRILAGKGANER